MKIEEKSVSIAQQRMMGQAYALKKGDIKLSDIDPEWQESIKKLADDMTLKDLEKFAKTKHDDLPNKIEEMKKTYTDGDESIEVKIKKDSKGTHVFYKIDDIEEPISKDLLRKIKKDLGEFMFHTNAGLELHSKEVKNNKWEGITIVKENKIVMTFEQFCKFK